MFILSAAATRHIVLTCKTTVPSLSVSTERGAGCPCDDGGMSESGVTLEQLLGRFRFARLELVAGPLVADRITGVVSLDEHTQVVDAEGLLVLGIGLQDAAAVAAAWRLWTDLGAIGLVVRTSVLDGPIEPVAGATALVGLGDEMSWIRLASMVTNDVDRAHRPGAFSDLDRADVLGDETDDFYAIASALSALAGGPVTIEDLASRILAFSEDQDKADEHRKRSILERRVSQEHNEVLERDGVFTRLYASPVPIFFQPGIEGARPRAAMRIRYGDETLGSIWAVVEDQLSSIQAQGMVEASNVLALSIMRRRLLDETRREERHTLVTRLLEGGIDTNGAASALGIADVPTFVMAIIQRTPDDDDLGSEFHARAVARSLTTFITAVHRRAVVAPVGRTVYAVVPFGAGDPDPTVHAVDASRLGHNLLQRVARDDVLLGIGDLISDVTQLSRSRRQADAAARALRHQSDAGRTVGYWRDLQVESLLIEMVDAMVDRHEMLAAPFDRLVPDLEGQLPTLQAYLDHFGDIGAASASVFVHPNTFRYRLRKISERAGLDLDNPDTRFSLMLQLRLHAYRHQFTAAMTRPGDLGAVNDD